MTRLFLTSLFLFLFSFQTGNSQGACAALSAIEENLIEQYHERRIFEGTTQGGSVFVFFVNDETGSWTILEVFGTAACVRASGQKAAMVAMGILL